MSLKTARRKHTGRPGNGGQFDHVPGARAKTGLQVPTAPTTDPALAPPAPAIDYNSREWPEPLGVNPIEGLRPLYDADLAPADPNHDPAADVYADGGINGPAPADLDVCVNCAGRGEIMAMVPNRLGDPDVDVDICPSCDGTGYQPGY